MDYTKPDRGIGKKCKDCGKSPEETVFGKHRRVTKKGIVYDEKSLCKTCESTRAKQYRQDHPDKVAEIKEKYHERHSGTIKHHVQEKIATWRKASCVSSDLTVEYLVSLYEQQDGYCFYSGEKMIFGWVDGKIHHNSLSLDKLDPAKGYVQDNVVWCTYLVNTMKQNMTDKQFYDAIDKIYETTYGVVMTTQPTIKEKLHKITMNARLGNLPDVILKECTLGAEKGATNYRMYFVEPPEGILPFIGSLGLAYRALWKDITKPFNKITTITREQFITMVINDLQQETGLKIEYVEPPCPDPAGPNLPYLHTENAGAYRYAFVVLDASWD